MEKLIAHLTGCGLRVGTVKHDVHGFQMDHEGKDSYRHKQAGAVTSLISSPEQIGMVRDVTCDHSLRELADCYLTDVDVVLAEGYNREKWPKVEVHRRALKRPLIATPETGLIAVVSDEPLPIPIPLFGPDDIADLSDFLVGHLNPVDED